MTTVPDAQPVVLEQNGDGAPGDNAPSYPETWLWEEDGDTCSGTFVRFDKGATRDYGKKLIMVLEVDGAERSVWLMQTALYSKVREEISERPRHKLEVGERVTIRRLPETKTEDGNRTYHPFRTYFPDRPELDVASEFGLGKPAPEGEAEKKDSPDADDDIPF